MFGFQSIRTKSAKAGLDALQTMMGILQSIGGPGIPSGMWEDPYIIGFSQMTISFRAKIATEGKARGVELGKALVDVYTAVSHLNGVAIARDANRLMAQRQPDYIRGANDAITIQEYMFGMLKDKNIPLVVQATSAAKETRPSEQAAIVTALMMKETWLKEVEKLVVGKSILHQS